MAFMAKYNNITRGGSRAVATSKMERFVIIVNGWKPLTIITKRSILDVAAALDPPLITLTAVADQKWAKKFSLFFCRSYADIKHNDLKVQKQIRLQSILHLNLHRKKSQE